jgi:hypothetical protein
MLWSSLDSRPNLDLCRVLLHFCGDGPCVVGLYRIHSMAALDHPRSKSDMITGYQIIRYVENAIDRVTIRAYYFRPGSILTDFSRDIYSQLCHV